MPPLNLTTRSETSPSPSSPTEHDPYYIPATTLSNVPPLGWILIGLLCFCFLMSWAVGQCLTWGQPKLTEKEWRRRREEEMEEMEREMKERERREWERQNALPRGLREEGRGNVHVGRDAGRGSRLNTLVE
ncbi:hypothetical protein B0H65DRAFT_86033 [Neurospora tetraspora]|uniref:Uncharacterized protein n=1 Tax=Neurospora tetraspora TaxID=94610 RepID=A0AAE0JJE1_9PEZI|nr:hypothetical protein B0H65DRAFT_86033 [Neurospora tetraspora]